MMFRVAALVALLATACTTPQARRAHRAGEVATAAGLIGMLIAGTSASLVHSHKDAILSGGLVFVPISVVGALVYIATDKQAMATEHVPTLTRRERLRLQAWELTKQAGAAAREQDCRQVEAIDPRVRDLDFDFHVSVFMRDVAIQRCLRR
jgi:uncharacterized membrane protein